MNAYVAVAALVTVSLVSAGVGYFVSSATTTAAVTCPAETITPAMRHFVAPKPLSMTESKEW